VSERILGSLRRLDDGKGGVRVEDVYDTDVDDLWSAVTDPSRLARWVAMVEGDLRVGGRVHARFTSGWEGPGRIDACEPPRRLLVTFEPGTPDETVQEAVLTPVGSGQTRLVVEDRGIPLDGIADYGAGWQAHVEDLAAYLSGGERGDWPRRVAELRAAYERLAEALS
jgi:uncharacterized protein YndB with AHSA1/START domain